MEFRITGIKELTPYGALKLQLERVQESNSAQCGNYEPDAFITATVPNFGDFFNASIGQHVRFGTGLEASPNIGGLLKGMGVIGISNTPPREIFQYDAYPEGEAAPDAIPAALDSEIAKLWSTKQSLEETFMGALEACLQSGLLNVAKFLGNNELLSELAKAGFEVDVDAVSDLLTEPLRLKPSRPLLKSVKKEWRDDLPFATEEVNGDLNVTGPLPTFKSGTAVAATAMAPFDAIDRFNAFCNKSGWTTSALPDNDPVKILLAEAKIWDDEDEIDRLNDEIERLEDESQTAGLVAAQEERNQQIDESVEKFVSTVTGKTTKKKKRRGIK